MRSTSQHRCANFTTKLKPAPQNIQEHRDIFLEENKKQHTQAEIHTRTHTRYLVEVFTGGSHLLPGLVEQLDADAEEFCKGAIVGEEHGVEVVAVFTGC